MRPPTPRPNLILILMVTGGLMVIVVLISFLTTPAQSAPHQPIDFLHSLHSGQLNIECAYCHRTAESAAYAGMPSTQLCMGCHRVVASYTPEIWKLRTYWEMREPVPWKRVYDLPAHVYFSHQAHTRTAGMGCEPCHGNVKSAQRLKQETPLTMGWCMDCHRREDASTECWSCHR